MSTKEFFNDQSDGTAVKINFYEDYIESYLFKILLSFGSCMIADLFCGPGKNGDKDGSPLILLKKATEVLKDEKFSNSVKSSSEIIVIFNDINKENINKLKSELSAISLPGNIKIIEPQNNKFSDIAAEIVKLNISMPKFFFLDPFTYGDIQLSEIKQLMDINCSEVMLFMPTFLAYRFATSIKNPQKLISFLNNFTDKGVYDYEDIYDFVNSIKRKIKMELGLKFVQDALIDVGKNKNSLFLLTKNTKGAMLFNNLFWKESYDGKSLNVSEIKHNEKEPRLFSKDVLPTAELEERVLNFQTKVIDELKKKRKMCNTEVIEFTVVEGFKPKHANDVLIKLKKENKIRVNYFSALKVKGFYVSEKMFDQKLCEIVFL
ncbi:MAG: three-Cys-motif partner protein TcmP [Patescibacteria group bacterium]